MSLKPYSYKDRIVFNDALNVYSDELGWIYGESNRRLKDKGLFIRGKLLKGKNESFILKFDNSLEISAVKSLHSIIPTYFQIFNDLKIQEIHKLVNILSPKPFLLMDEVIEISVLYKDKEVKKLEVPVSQKEFFNKQNSSFLQKPIGLALFQRKELEKITDSVDLVFKVRLIKSNEIRSAIDFILEDLGKCILMNLIPKSYENFFKNFKSNNINCQPSYIPIYFYFKNGYVDKSGNIIRGFIDEVEENSKLKSFIQECREILFVLEESGFLNLVQSQTVKTDYVFL